MASIRRGESAKSSGLHTCRLSCFDSIPSQRPSERVVFFYALYVLAGIRAGAKMRCSPYSLSPVASVMVAAD
jgi:hypothetical protein